MINLAVKILSMDPENFETGATGMEISYKKLQK